jgi:RNA polymerase sigma factor (TIGR02999 family)
MPGEITQLLAELRDGKTASESRLAELVYDELHRIASRFMRSERPDHSLQTTVLVDDAYLNLVNQEDRSWENRSHFYAVAAQSMRHILIDHARGRRAAKRGGGRPAIHLEESLAISEDKCDEMIAVDEALVRLAAWDPRLSRIVEMRFFGGLTLDEIAAVLGISVRTVKREWQVAKAWLHCELSGAAHDGSSVAEN